MSFKVSVLEADREQEYSDFLLKSKDSVVQQTLAWRSVLSESFKESGDEHYYLVADDPEGRIVGVLPAFIRKSKLGNVLNSLPNAGTYGGVVAKDRNPEIYKALLSRLDSLALEKGCVLSTIMNAPFADDLDAYIRVWKPDFWMRNFYQYLELPLTKDHNKKIRWSIKKAAANGIKVSDSVSEGNVRRFYDLYAAHMDSLRVRKIPLSFVSSLVKNLYPDRARLFFTEKDGEIISGVLLVFNKNTADYFMVSADEHFRNLEPNLMLVDHCLRFMGDEGVKRWNWQSSQSRDSGVYRFKQQWGSEEGYHYYMTKILGDISKIKAAGIEEVRKEYAWYYVLPNSELGGVNKETLFRK